jgi:hypothetical protein
VGAAKAVHRAYSDPGSLVLMMSPCGRQSGEFVRKAKTFVARLGIKARSDGDNDLSIAFPNGSRIIGLPGNEAMVRGFTASLILIDEAARVPDELYRAMRPSLAVGNGEPVADEALLTASAGSFGRNGARGRKGGNGFRWRGRSVRGFRSRFWRRSAKRGDK